MKRVGILFLIVMIAISCDSNEILLQSVKEPLPPISTKRSVSEAYSIASSAIALLDETNQTKGTNERKIISTQTFSVPTKASSQDTADSESYDTSTNTANYNFIYPIRMLCDISPLN